MRYDLNGTTVKWSPPETGDVDWTHYKHLLLEQALVTSIEILTVKGRETEDMYAYCLHGDE